MGKFQQLRSGELLLCLVVVYICLQAALWQITGSRFESAGLSTNTDSHGFQDLNTRNIRAEPSYFNLELEIQNGIKYAQSITNVQRKLVFVHIPKSAGSAIEEVAGLQARIPWGSCLFNHRPRRPRGVCRYPKGQFEWPSKIGYWHLPTQFFPLMGTNPYHGADLFAVIREPRDRLISEFYYVCRKKVNKNWNVIGCNRTRVHDPSYMNAWLKQNLHRTPTLEMFANDYLDQNGHFTPQSHFVFSRFDVRMVDYVLRMDNLQTYFPRLMHAYCLNVTLPPEKTNTARNTSADLKPGSIDFELDLLIHEKYGRNFEFFG